MEEAREALAKWQADIKRNLYENDADFKHSVALYLSEKVGEELSAFGERVPKELDPLVMENNLARNLPYLEGYDGLGMRYDKVVHHPSYAAAGDIIYGSRLMEKMAKPGGLLEALCFMFLSSQAGEAGHNCPIACSAGIIRVLQKVPDFPKKKYFLEKLTAPSYRENFTGAQFLTEIQGGSDVGLNKTLAYRDDKKSWRIRGEKWFCSNANAELILMTARFDPSIAGTKGLGLFLVPATLESGEKNHYTMRRLKDKIGTRSMASAEMDFHGAYAIAMGEPAEGFKMVMENVLHISRLFNTFCVLAMARRAFHLALSYAHHRVAFGHPIFHYPLVKENLARIKAENSALLASIFATVRLQDDFDLGKVKGEEVKLLLRHLANLNKYISALWSVEHIHHALDTLAGNGAIESFSIIPRLLRDSIVCENWEGTHNVLRMQILRDMARYQVDEIFLRHLESLGIEKFRAPFERLKKDINRLKESSEELQSLLIKSVVDQMAQLYAGVQLSKEAEQGSPSKAGCLQLFTHLHLSDQAAQVDQRTLELINGSLQIS